MDCLVTLFRRSAIDSRSDGELLAAFLGNQDEAAFGELVRRHGPTVWGVCRRTLTDLTAAEDAFQATFLVLVRRASRLVTASTVGPWLFEVAVRTAASARRKNSRRQALFAELPDAIADSRPTPAHPTDLDTLLLGLPERYRAVLLMCFLEGLTHREAASRLGCAEGTVSSLVSRGLAKLRTKFAGREPAAVLAVTSTAVPAALTAAVVRSAVALRLAFLSAVPPAVAALTRGVLRMFWIKKAMTAAVVAAMALAMVVGLERSVGQSARAIGQEKPPSTKTAQDVKGQPDKAVGKKSLEGVWLLVARETNGEKKEFPQGVGIQLAINGDEFSLIEYQESVFGGKHKSGTHSTYSWRLPAPVEGKPRGIDLVDGTGKAWKEGIYKLEGNTLTICWGEEKRPTDFTTKPDSGNTMNVFKRLDGEERKEAPSPQSAQRRVHPGIEARSGRGGRGLQAIQGETRRDEAATDRLREGPHPSLMNREYGGDTTPIGR